MGESTFLITLRVVTTITSVLVCLAPLPDVLRVARQRHTGDMSVLPLVMIFSNSHLWAIYGYLTDNIFPLFVQCVIGVIANAVFIVIYYRHSSHSERQRVVRLSSIAATCLAIVTAYVVLGTNGTLGDAFRNVTTPMGYISVAINIFMYGSPLEVMMDVIRAKSAAALPIAFIVMSFINCALWVALGLAVHDVFVLTPNVISTAVSAVQIVLYLIYPPQKGTDDEERSLVWDHPGAGVATFPVYEANALPTHHVHPKTSSE